MQCSLALSAPIPNVATPLSGSTGWPLEHRRCKWTDFAWEQDLPCYCVAVRSPDLNHIRLAPRDTACKTSYSTFNLPMKAGHICLLGDICLVKDVELFVFLGNPLKSSPNLRPFYVFSNREAYQVSMGTAIKTMTGIEERMRQSYGERFFFLKNADI